MLLTRPMATFTTYCKARPGSMKTVGFQLVIFLKIGRMAGCTHRIPVLRSACPMHPVAMINLLPGILMKPTLFLHIPTHPRSLHPPSGKSYQILLQGLKTKCVQHLKISISSIRPLGADEKFTIFFIKGRCNTVCGKPCVVKITQNRGVIRRHHCPEMIRFQIQIVFFLVAGLAGLIAHKGILTHGHFLRFRFTILQQAHRQKQQAC